MTGNKISEKYASFKGTTQEQINRALETIWDETGFNSEEEVFRGLIYDNKKVSTFIMKGSVSAEPMVLKIQFLKPDIEEGLMISKLKEQSLSERIAPPKTHVFKEWNAHRGYGFMLQEWVKGNRIFEMPYALEVEMREFCGFYEEYKTKLVRKPWLTIPENDKDSVRFVLERARKWKDISEKQKRVIPLPEFGDRFEAFGERVKKRFSGIPMEFMHGHLSTNDILRRPNGTYVIMSNAFWSWRPKGYDLLFNIWSCLLRMRDSEVFFDLYKPSMDWLEAYDRNLESFEKGWIFKNFNALLLERVMGSLLLDIGSEILAREGIEGDVALNLQNAHMDLLDWLLDDLR